MKSFTDINQSKKLAEILPVESADMFWADGERPAVWNNKDISLDDTDIPAWSLAVLLSVIPQEIFDGEYIINITEGLDNRWVLTYDNCENRHHSYFGLSSGADNLIDACYEMILKLHKRKLL